MINEINQASSISTLPQKLQPANIISTLENFERNDRGEDATKIAEAMQQKANFILDNQCLKSLPSATRLGWQTMLSNVKRFLNTEQELSR